MDTSQIPTLDLNKVMNGGLMQDMGTVMEQGGIGITIPPLGVVLGGHVYIPILPPLPILPVLIAP